MFSRGFVSRREAELAEAISAAEAVRMLGIHTVTVVDLVKKGELRGHKETIARTSPFLVERDSILDFDRRRRAQTGAQVS